MLHVLIFQGLILKGLILQPLAFQGLPTHKVWGKVWGVQGVGDVLSFVGLVTLRPGNDAGCEYLARLGCANQRPASSAADPSSGRHQGAATLNSRLDSILIDTSTKV